MMKRKLQTTAVRVLATLAVAFASGGCAMKGDIRTLQDELRAVSARQDSLMAELRNETRQTQDTLRVQGDQMFDLRGDINRQLQMISESLVRLEAIAGENQRGLTAVRDQLANMRRMPVAPMGAPVQPDSAGAGGESLIGGAGNPDELWGVAQAQYQRQSLNSAAAAFQQFIEEHPSDARVPNAHFFLADILVQQGRPDEALEAFEEIQALFPTHERVPEALYRIAELQLELGDTDAAKLTLERIVNTYPGSTMAMLARDKLEEIG
jgi:tol-pal system protein YbgF